MKIKKSATINKNDAEFSSDDDDKNKTAELPPDTLTVNADGSLSLNHLAQKYVENDGSMYAKSEITPKYGVAFYKSIKSFDEHNQQQSKF